MFLLTIIKTRTWSLWHQLILSPLMVQCLARVDLCKDICDIRVCLSQLCCWHLKSFLHTCGRIMDASLIWQQLQELFFLILSFLLANVYCRWLIVGYYISIFALIIILITQYLKNKVSIADIVGQFFLSYRLAYTIS